MTLYRSVKLSAGIMPQVKFFAVLSLAIAVNASVSAMHIGG